LHGSRKKVSREAALAMAHRLEAKQMVIENHKKKIIKDGQ
jgi:hypothetical protein